MPIYEFQCQSCGHCFEELCRVGSTPEKCIHCNSTNLIKKMSTFAAQSTGSQGTQTIGGGHSCGSCHSGHCSSCH